MVPQKIALINFLSYRERTELNFQGIHLACIAGPNGSGKSTLLDAITWSLFGRSRSKSDDNVVNKTAAALGEAAEVAFIFDLEGVCYRIIRRKKVRKTMRLNLSVAAADGSWKPLTESKLRETQAVIEQLLKMNYETFTNASFFLQNGADAFTTNSATHRKEILAKLLGLDIWDIYRDRVAIRRRDEQIKISIIDNKREEIDQELSEEPEREAALVLALRALDESSSELILMELEVRELRKAESEIEELKRLVNMLDETTAASKSSLLELEDTFDRHSLERENLQLLLDDAQSINEAYESWQEAAENVNIWQNKSYQNSRIIEKLRPLEIQVGKEEARLNERYAELERQAAKTVELQADRQGLLIDLERTRSQSKEMLVELDGLKEVKAQFSESDSELRLLESNRAALEKEVNILQNQRDQYDEKIREMTLVQRELTMVNSAVESYKLDLKAIEDARLQLATITTAAESIGEEQKLLRQEMYEIEESINTLSISLEEICPLCGQTLSEQHRQKVLDQLRKDGNKLGDKFRSNRVDIESSEAKHAELTAVIKRSKPIEGQLTAEQNRKASAEQKLHAANQDINQWQQVGIPRLKELETVLAGDGYISLQESVALLGEKVSRYSTLEESKLELDKNQGMMENYLASIDQSIAEWQNDDQRLSPSQEFEELTQILRDGTFAQQEKQQIDLLLAEVKEIGFNQDQYNSAAKERDALSDAPKRYQLLSTASSAVKHLDDNLLNLSNQIEELRSKISLAAEQEQEAAGRLRSLKASIVELSELETELQLKRDAQILAHRKVATAQQDVDVLAKLKAQKKELWEEKDAKVILIQRIKMLELAFGKAGVQSLLIETALPEIENDANLILERLSEGEMRVRLESQRKLKSADRSVETLDILISDAAGQRPYENFSGGEQFRVNFAIRLALSKILARRADARLQTLVIDEGFGSQDPMGRQRLVEAINSIRDDFERILIITHIDELRDTFPTQIRVSKGRDGSSMKVV